MGYKNIAVKPEIHSRAKVTAARVGRALGRIVEELLLAWMEREEKESEGEHVDTD